MKILGTYHKTFRPIMDDGYVMQERTILMVITTDGDYTVGGIIALVDSGYLVEVSA